MLVQILQDFLTKDLSLANFHQQLMDYVPSQDEINYHDKVFRSQQTALIKLIDGINNLYYILRRYPIDMSLDELTQKTMVENPAHPMFNTLKRQISTQEFVGIETVQPIFNLLDGKITIARMDNQFGDISGEKPYIFAIVSSMHFQNFTDSNPIALLAACSYLISLFVDYVKNKHVYLHLALNIPERLIITDHDDIDESHYIFSVTKAYLSDNTVMFQASMMASDYHKNELFPTGGELMGYAYLDSMGTIQFELPNIQSGENLTLTIFKI